MTEIIFQVIQLCVMIAVLCYLRAVKKVREDERASEILTTSSCGRTSSSDGLRTGSARTPARSDARLP